MKKIILYILLLITVSCSNNYCNYIENNKERLNQLLMIIEGNPMEFSNSQTVPRAYFTFNYEKDYSEFKKTKSAKNIDFQEYKILRDDFEKLSIKKLIIFDNQNILFKIENIDFFVSNYNIYIGHLNQKYSEEINKYFEILDYKECELDWYYLLERTSIAN